MAYVPLGANGRYETKVSDEHYGAITRYRWQYKISAWHYRNNRTGVYAKRSARINGRRVTILLSHFVLEVLKKQPRPSQEHDADHIDRNSLNDSGENLRWRHARKNRAWRKRK